MIQRDIDRLNKLIRHIKGVQDSAIILGEKLIDKGQFNLGKTLIANCMKHDNSKFYGTEWDYLSVDGTDIHDLKIAVGQHNHTNRHHPEFYDKGIHDMPLENIAEMVCDWKTRSAERGTSLRDWILDEATKRYSFSIEDDAYGAIMSFVDLLVEPPLRNVKEL
jgi:hypothetical protein